MFVLPLIGSMLGAISLATSEEIGGCLVPSFTLENAVFPSVRLPALTTSDSAPLTALRKIFRRAQAEDTPHCETVIYGHCRPGFELAQANKPGIALCRDRLGLCAPDMTNNTGQTWVDGLCVPASPHTSLNQTADERLYRFVIPKPLHVPDANHNLHAIAQFVDVNGDDRADLVYGYPETSVYLNTGNDGYCCVDGSGCSPDQHNPACSSSFRFNKAEQAMHSDVVAPAAGEALDPVIWRALVKHQRGKRRDELAKILKAHRIDANVLPDLTEADLDRMGVRAVGDRKRLLALATHLGETSKTPPRPSSVFDGKTLKALQASGLEQYIPLLMQHHIDSPILLTMSASDLEDIGIKSFGHRHRMMDIIGKLSNAANQPVNKPKRRLHSQITKMFRTLGFGQEAKIRRSFADAGMDLSTLAMLSASPEPHRMLRDELHVTSLAQRLKILDYVQKKNDQTASK